MPERVDQCPEIHHVTVSAGRAGKWAIHSAKVDQGMRWGDLEREIAKPKNEHNAKQESDAPSHVTSDPTIGDSRKAANAAG